MYAQNLIEACADAEAMRLLKSILESVEGEVILSDAGTDEKARIADAPEVLPYEKTYLDLRTGDRVYGLVTSPENATFSLCDGERTVFVALLEEPVSVDELRADDQTEIPLFYAYMKEQSRKFSFEELRALARDEEGAPDGGESAEKSPEAGEDSEENQFLNDAEIIGQSTPEMERVLNSDVTLLIGEMWGARDRRNTQDGDWSPTTMTWAQWINGGPKTKGAPAWGFSRHPVGKHKQGSCVVLGSSVGQARKAKAMDTMYAMGLDIDSGTTFDTVVQRIEEQGLFALVMTSYNHGKTELEIKRDEVLKKLKIKHDPSVREIQQFLLEHSKDRYDQEFLASIEIIEQKRHLKEGIHIALKTMPLHKLRIIFPLDKPVQLTELGEQEEALSIWEDKITGLALNTLGVHFDTSCTDPSRLFFLPRHPKGGDWDSVVVQGKPLRFGKIEPYKKSLYTSHREKMNAFQMAGASEEQEGRPPQCWTPSGKNLNAWHSKVKDRFQLADLLQDHCSDRIRIAGGEAQGHVHVECVFEGEHSEPGGTACMAVNALDSTEGWWTWFCHHDSCQGRHKLEFLQKALEEEWFPEELLADEAYVMPAEDEDNSEEQDKQRTAFLKKASELPQSAATDKIKSLLREVLDGKLEGAELRAVLDAIGEQTFGKSGVKKLYYEVKQEARKAKRAAEKGVSIHADHNDQVDYVIREVAKKNEKAPFLFNYLNEPAEVENGRVALLDKEGLRARLNRTCRFTKEHDDDKVREVATPWDVVGDVYNARYADFLHPLRGVVTTPFFSADGELVCESGYHAGSQVYLDPTVVIPKVSSEPSAEEVAEAKRLLVEEVLADFPLQGLSSRSELVEQALSGAPVPAVAHIMALLLLPFAREMIAGATPAHILHKPAAGTGATLLADVVTTIANGEGAPPNALPRNKDELHKTLSSILFGGATHAFFDNVSHTLDSAELALVLTSRTYQSRDLGRSRVVKADNRAAWIITANNIEVSSELERRSIGIKLDAHMERPEERREFRHADIRGWVHDNRPRLVWAALTLISNWVAQGRPGEHPDEREDTLASFESWSKVMGGCLFANGFRGFLQGREELREEITSSSEQDVKAFITHLAQFADGTLFRVRPGQDAESLSLIDELSKADDGAPLLLPGWGHEGGMYENSRKVGMQFNKLAKRPWNVSTEDGDFEVTFSCEKDRKGTNRYRLHKASV